MRHLNKSEYFLFCGDDNPISYCFSQMLKDRLLHRAKLKIYYISRNAGNNHALVKIFFQDQPLSFNGNLLFVSILLVKQKYINKISHAVV